MMSIDILTHCGKSAFLKVMLMVDIVFPGLSPRKMSNGNANLYCTKIKIKIKSVLYRLNILN